MGPLPGGQRSTTAQPRSTRGVHFFLHHEPKQGDLVYERFKDSGYRRYKEWLQKLMFGLGQKIALRLQNGEEISPLIPDPLTTFRVAGVLISE